MTKLITKTLNHVYDELEALRETPLRPRDELGPRLDVLLEIEE